MRGPRFARASTRMIAPMYRFTDAVAFSKSTCSLRPTAAAHSIAAASCRFSRAVPRR